MAAPLLVGKSGTTDVVLLPELANRHPRHPPGDRLQVHRQAAACHAVVVRGAATPLPRP